MKSLTQYGTYGFLSMVMGRAARLSRGLNRHSYKREKAPLPTNRDFKRLIQKIANQRNPTSLVY